MNKFIRVTVGLITGILLLLCLSAVADEDYYYCMAKTNLVKVVDGDNEYLKPDLPYQLYSYYAVTEGSDVTYSKDLKLNGKEILAVIAVKKENETAIKAFAGYVGDEFEIVKDHADYTKHYPFTIKDIKLKYDEETGEIIEYEGIDKDNKARFSLWCEKKTVKIEKF